ncbi:MAG: hypothetical protein F7C37_06070 [Desulfurococcales archaeon]|nr:hypothetical protein [Desulfurococcales archaeon]MCE4626438.1 hypothetical protein [Desulfurococcales archaeon]
MVAICEICGENPATQECTVCGRYVCNKHISNGICSICKETLCMICGRKPSIGYCISCGRLGCDDCLIQVDNVRRICIDCAKSKGIALHTGGTYRVTRLGFSGE